MHQSEPFPLPARCCFSAVLTNAIRSILRRPAFSIAIVVALALSIGATTTMFTLVNSILLHPLPFQDPQRLIWIWSTRVDIAKAFFSIPNFIDTRSQATKLKDLAGFANWSANLTGSGDAERLTGVRVLPNTFEMLGVHAIVGRSINKADGRSGSDHVVMLTFGLWQRRFGGRAEVIGQTLDLNGEPYTVAGITPRNFIFPGAEPEIMVPLVLESDSRRSERGSNFIRVFAKLKPGVTVTEAQQELTAITERLRAQYPNENGKHTPPRVLLLQDEIVGSYKTALWMLFGAVGTVLLITCANLANMLLVRSTMRRRELAIRTALGAGRPSLVGQLLGESLILSVAGGAVGILVSSWAIRIVILLGPADLPRAREIALSGTTFLFTAAVSIIVGIAFALAPIWQTSRVDVSESLRETGRTLGSSGRGTRIRNVLVVAEVALSLVLLITAALLTTSFIRLQSVQPGADPQNVLTARIALPPTRYSNSIALGAFIDILNDKVRSISHVEFSSLISVLPLSGMNTRADFTIVGKPPLSASEVPAAQVRWITPDYFRAVRIPLIAGRGFEDRDKAGMQAVVIIDETLARRQFPNANPIGQHILLDDTGDPPRDVEVIGVVGSVKHFGLDDQPISTLYAHIPQVPKGGLSFLLNNLNLIVRTETDPRGVGDSVRLAVQDLDKDIPVAGIRTLEDAFSAVSASRRFNLVLAEIFAVASLLLVVSGLYALISYAVSERRHEIGIRLAIGATRTDVQVLMLGHAMRLVSIGIAIGGAAAFAITRVFASMLYGVHATDIRTFAGMAVLLSLSAVIASYVPARRASRLDPVHTLRET